MARLQPIRVPLQIVMPEKPNKWLRAWIYCRKLIRRRQLTRALRIAMDQRRLDELRFNKVMDRAQKEIDALKEELARKNQEIRSLHEHDIPVLERKLEVEKSYSEYLAALHERELSAVEADIAMHHTRVTDQANIRQIIRNNSE